MTELPKILARVKFNKEYAYVLDDIPEVIYTKKDNVYVGKAGIFYDVLTEYRDRFDKAFADREIEIKMDDGSVYSHKGCLWSNTPNNLEEFGIPQLYFVTIQCQDALRDCYVYRGMYTDAAGLNYLDSFEGKLWEYYEYEKYIKNLPMLLKHLRQYLKRWNNPNAPMHINGVPLAQNDFHCRQVMNEDIPINIITNKQTINKG